MSAAVLKLEFNPGGVGWIDISAYASGSTASIHVGRSNQFGDADVATLTGIELDNTDGRFTPQSQLLADGTTANPYYPNLLPRTLVRLSYTISGTPYYVFWGYIQGFPPLMRNGDTPYVPIAADDRGTILSKTYLRAPFVEQVFAEGAPVAFYAMNDPQPATGQATFADSIFGNTITSAPNLDGSDTVALVAGASDPMPFSDGLTGASGSQSNTAIQDWGALLKVGAGGTVTATAIAIGCWVTLSKQNGGQQEFTITLNNLLGSLVAVTNIDDNGTGSFATSIADHSTLTVGSNVKPDTTPHFHMLKLNGTTMEYTIDGISIATKAYSSSVLGARIELAVLQSWGTGGAPAPISPIVVGPIVVYVNADAVAVSPLNLYNAGNGWEGDLSGARITRYLTAAGVAGVDMAIAAGAEVIGGQHSINGKTVQQACSEIAATEGGGAVFYHDMNGGDSTFLDRNYRNGTTPLFTLDAAADLDGPSYAPAFDAQILVNTATLTRAGGSSQTYTDVGSEATYGPSADPGGDVYTDSDAATLRLAQSRVSSQSRPGFRIGQLAVDLMTATTAGLYALFGVLKVGSRTRVSNLQAARSAPLNQVDVYTEGWTWTLGPNDAMCVMDTTPADAPARGVVSTIRAAPLPGNMTLNTTLTSSGTTAVVAHSDAFAMTSSAGSYPMTIRFGEEQIVLNSAPTGTNPQTFTGCTRGANGTRAAAQTAGSVLTPFPDYRVQL